MQVTALMNRLKNSGRGVQFWRQISRFWTLPLKIMAPAGHPKKRPQKELVMPKLTIQVSLFTCRHCGQGYNNRLSHVCRVPFHRLAQRRIRSGSKPVK